MSRPTRTLAIATPLADRLALAASQRAPAGRALSMRDLAERAIREFVGRVDGPLPPAAGQPEA